MHELKIPKKRQSLQDEFLLEGGKATEGTPIKREDIDTTLIGLESTILGPVLGLSLSECPIVGSTGKKPEGSGDIDIAIPFEKIFDVSEDDFFYHYPEYLSDIFEDVKKVAPKSRLNLIFKQIHSTTPIIDHSGQETGDYAQADLIFGNIDYLQWTLFSDPSRTKYPSWVRNALLVAVSQTKTLDEYEEMKVRYIRRLSYNVNSGLLERLEYKYLGDPESEDPQLLSLELLTSDPDEVAAALFSTSVTSQDLMIAEDVLKVIQKSIKDGDLDAHKLADAFDVLLKEEKETRPEISSLVRGWAS